MKVPLSWLKEYVDIDLPPEELAHKLTMAGTEVGGIDVVGGSWDNVFVGYVVSVDPHPNADRLRLATVSLDGEEMTVVCGAPNVAAGQKVPFAKVGARLIDARTGECRDDGETCTRARDPGGSLSPKADVPREVVARPAGRAFHDETSGVHKRPKPVLKGAPRGWRLEHGADPGCRRPIRVSLYCFQNREQVPFRNAPRHGTLRPAGWTVRANFNSGRKNTCGQSAEFA